MSEPLRIDMATQHQLRELAPQVLGAMVRRYRDFAASEDAVQEALIAAAAQWPRDGVPQNPRAWLIHVAARRLKDHVRSESARRLREAIVVSMVSADEQLALAADEESRAHGEDDTLELLFMCCHPALSPASSIALTLRAVAGLTTLEIAAAFMVPEATMAQRISRAKQSIEAAGARFLSPTQDERAQRLGAVMHALYLMFSEGYATSSGTQLLRNDLADEAIRLSRLLRRLAPDDCEVAGLLALMLLTDARRAARTGPAGELISLEEQDRSRWNRAAIEEGVAILAQTLPRGAVGAYQLQAAIAAVHDEAPSAEQTDWVEILGLYELLRRMQENPMVELSHAIATAMVHGPSAGLSRLHEIERDPRLASHHRLPAVRAHLLERAGEHASAIASFERAAQLTPSLAERDHLLLRAARLREAHAW